MLTVQEASRVLGISIHTVYRLINSGDLSAVKISPRKTVIKAEEIKNTSTENKKDYSMIYKEILTREEVMEILKIGRSTFYKLLQTCELKSFKEGNRCKVPMESIEEYVNKRMQL
ncbi:MAG: helix-turn-helix domain-containing protein [Ruminococcus flavefaciens]|nr:helix-turn-helix domain-containing protein [Ruminococcus flavefaciens]MCM1363017.1 helix-turn-helix domain-containing protein [Clostridiales bacterium]